ncbi:MAG: amidohydrolase [Acidobacteria bacterium]|nr:amidohydrolase [Acidobacteriota bacterium]
MRRVPAACRRTASAAPPYTSPCASGPRCSRWAMIEAVGKRAEIEKRFPAGQRLDAGDAILAPGLINAHTHAPMALFRGIAGDMRLREWLERYIFPAEARNVSPDFVRWGTRLACLEMLLSGVTTYADMYYFEEVIAEATREAGMRGILGQTILGFPAPDAKTPEAALQRAELFLRRFDRDPLIVPAVAPHAVYTNSDSSLKAARVLANRYRKPLLIHLSETRRENDDLRAARNLTPAALLESLGVLSGRTLAAHGIWLDDADMRILARRGTGVAHCPSSNMMLASGIAPVRKLLAAKIAVGLGTDGPAGSNNDLDLFEEMDLAAKLQKISLNDPEALSAETAVELATIGGARALGLANEIGSLEPGKRADLITISLREPHAVPLFNVYSQLVYALKGSDVRDVMINGRLVVRDRRVLTLNAAEILAKARSYQQAIRKSLRF